MTCQTYAKSICQNCQIQFIFFKCYFFLSTLCSINVYVGNILCNIQVENMQSQKIKYVIYNQEKLVNISGGNNINSSSNHVLIINSNPLINEILLKRQLYIYIYIQLYIYKVVIQLLLTSFNLPVQASPLLVILCSNSFLYQRAYDEQRLQNPIEGLR